MVQRIGAALRGRLGPEGVRMVTMVGAVGLVVAAMAISMEVSDSGTAVAVSGVGAAILGGGGKVLLDRSLLGGKRDRREQDTQDLGARLQSLPRGWHVYPNPLVGGAVVEFLVIGPGGVFAVEVFRWLVRTEGTDHHEIVAEGLAGRAADIENKLGKFYGGSSKIGVQPVFFLPEAEGINIGDLVVQEEPGEVRQVKGVLLGGADTLLRVVKGGGSRRGVRTRALSQEEVRRLAGLMESGM